MGRRVQRRPSVDDIGSEALQQRPHPRSGGHGDYARAPRRDAKPAVPSLDLPPHVGVVLLDDLADVSEKRLCGLALVRVEVNPDGVPVADDHHRVAELLEPGDEELRIDSVPDNDEVRAPPEAAVLVMGGNDLWRLVMRNLDRFAAKARVNPRHQEKQAVTPRVDHTVLGENWELLGGSIQGCLTRVHSHLEQLREQCVLLVIRRLGLESNLRHLADVLLDRVRHLFEHREHRSGSRVRDRLPSRVDRLQKRDAHQLRVDELTFSLRKHLGRPADDLAEDHSGIAARSHQGCVRHGVDDRLPSPFVDLLPSRPAEPSSTAWSVSAMLSPVSPSATGNTFRSFTSRRRSSR